MRAPSSRVSIVILITAIMVTGVIVFSGIKTQKNNQTGSINSELGPNISINLAEQNTQKDTDSDGLLDWEEYLWNTDINNPDTDGDETSDAEEVRLNRNPKKAGPDDYNYSFGDTISKDLEKNPIDKNSLTYKAFLTLVNKYFALSQGGQLDDTTKKQLVDELFSGAVKSVEIETVYDYRLAKSFDPSKDKDGVLKYATNLLSIQNNITQNISTVSDGEGNSGVSEILINESKNMVRLEIPEKVVEIQFDLANNVYKLGILLNGLSTEDKDDPLLSIINLMIFNQVSANIKKDFSSIYFFLYQNDIIYDGQTGSFKLSI